MLRAESVSVGFGGAPVLDGVTVEVRRGRRLGILGPNGAGKTTLLRLLAGLLGPASGSVRLGGRSLSAMARAAVARRVAVVPQSTDLAFEFTALELVLMGRHVHLGPLALEGPADVAIARDALRATGTEALAGRQFTTLSGGERQRVVIAAALAQLAPAPAGGGAQPGESVLLLDEPTASLDLARQLEIAALLRSLTERDEIALAVATHDLDFACAVCDDLLLLRDGRVAASGPTEAVLTADNVRALYGVPVDVLRHPASGRLLVVPLAPVPSSTPAPLPAASSPAAPPPAAPAATGGA